MTEISKLDYYLIAIKKSKESITRDELEEFLDTTELTRDELIGLVKSFKDHNQACFVYGLTLLGSFGVLESIYDKASQSIEMPEFEFPTEGLSMKQLPKYAHAMTKLLKENLSENALPVLADNHHHIPDEAFYLEKEYYSKSKDLKSYLLERHQRKVEELQVHADSKKVWFEQVITQEVVDYVKANPEMLSGVLKEDGLYVTKIPYDTLAYLSGNNDLEKRYAYCHCGLAREAIKSDEKVDPDWCYCSAGFAKKPFEVILDKPLKVQVLKSVLNGDMSCRFRIYSDEPLES